MTATEVKQQPAGEDRQIPAEEYLTKKEVEARLRLHRSTMGRLLAAGRFPNAFRTGRQWRKPAADVETFIRASRDTNGHAALGEVQR